MKKSLHLKSSIVGEQNKRAAFSKLWKIIEWPAKKSWNLASDWLTADQSEQTCIAVKKLTANELPLSSVKP